MNSSFDYFDQFVLIVTFRNANYSHENNFDLVIQLKAHI